LATVFNGAEGCWLECDTVYFSTKGDNRVWALDTPTPIVKIFHDCATAGGTEPMNVDNVYASPNVDVYVAEDPGELRIVALTAAGDVKPVVQLEGVTGTEITGPALSPDGQHLDFRSQRNPGEIFEVESPFAPLPTVPAIPGMGAVLLAAALSAAGVLALHGRLSEED